MNIVGTAWGCPMVAYGPGDSSWDHTPKEHIELKEFRRAQDALTRTLELLAVRYS
jgi:LysW-gamma-L-lysine carboxypeptidase